jgi:hypothetical protein
MSPSLRLVGSRPSSRRPTGAGRRRRLAAAARASFAGRRSAPPASLPARGGGEGRSLKRLFWPAARFFPFFNRHPAPSAPPPPPPPPPPLHPLLRRRRRRRRNRPSLRRRRRPIAIRTKRTTTTRTPLILPITMTPTMTPTRRKTARSCLKLVEDLSERGLDAPWTVVLRNIASTSKCIKSVSGRGEDAARRLRPPTRAYFIYTPSWKR